MPAASTHATFGALTRVDRYVLREIFVPFAFSVGFAVLVVFLFQVQRMATAAVGMGLTLGDVLTIFAAALPPFLVLAVPIAFMMSVLLGMGRMAVDRELTALAAAGAPPHRLARVPLVLGFVVSVLCLPIAHFGEPLGLEVMYERLIDVGLRNITSAIRPGVFNEGFRSIALYAGGRSDDGKLQDVLLFDERDPKRPILIASATGNLVPATEHQILFTLGDGEIHLGAGTDDSRYDRVRFETAQLGIDTERELRDRARFISEIGRLTSPQMRTRAAQLGPDDRLGRRIMKTYWRRFAFPAMAFVFGLIGAAIALSGGPRARARNAVWAIASIVAYYLLTRVGDYAVVQWPGTPFLAAVVPNVLALIAGFIALSRSGYAR